MTCLTLWLIIFFYPSISSGTFENKQDRFKRSEEKRNKLDCSDVDLSVSSGTFKNELDHLEASKEKINKLDRSNIDPLISTESFKNKLGRFKRSEEKENKLDSYKRSEEKENKLERSNVDPPIWINFVEQVLIEDPTVNKCFVSLNIVSRKDSSQILNLAAFLNTKLTR
jgi:hypothetical protein